jgi:hypothetical protein
MLAEFIGSDISWLIQKKPEFPRFEYRLRRLQANCSLAADEFQHIVVLHFESNPIQPDVPSASVELRI